VAVGTPISLVVSVVPGTIPANGTLDFLNGLILTTNVTAIPDGTVKAFTTLADVGGRLSGGKKDRENDFRLAQRTRNALAKR